MKLTVKKQSLIDWFVEDETGKTVARIEKVKFGYEVYLRLFDFKGPYFFGAFKEAKACAIDPNNI